MWQYKKARRDASRSPLTRGRLSVRFLDTLRATVPRKPGFCGNEASCDDQANYLLSREKHYTLAVFSVRKESVDVQRPEETTKENAEAQAQEAPQTAEIPQATELRRTPPRHP